MNFLDIIIVIVLILFAILGFNRGVFQSLIILLGFIIVIFTSYTLKNYIGDIFVLNLPFISFGNFFNGVSSLNIIMYQAFAFIIMLIIFGLIYKFLITISGIFEKILRITVILGIPSKILGLFVGFIEGYIIVYLSLFILSQPFLQLDMSNESKYAEKILNNSPVISNFAENSLRLVNKVTDITKIEDKEAMDLKIAKLILDEKVTSKEVMQKLIEKGKLKGEDIKELVNNYK